MIDLHSHILYGVDDGARTIEESLMMASQAAACGVTHMMCTPHFHQGIFDNDINNIKLLVNELAEELSKNSIKIKLASAGEVRLTPDIVSWYQMKSLPYLGSWQGKELLLLELPHSHIPPGTENLIKWLLKHNIQPVIPHPERNRDIMADYRKLLFLKRQGCLFQITAGSLVKRFSERSYEISCDMLTEDLVFYIASDTHDTKRRPNDMRLARDFIRSNYSEELARELTLTIPEKITSSVEWQ